MIREAIGKLVEGKELAQTEAGETMREIMSGKTTEAQIAALATALRMRGETVEEITAFAEAMRGFCHQIHPRVAGTLVDTCGTGGDGANTFNVSTVAAFVAAGAGVAVAKHGNRSFTSRCGSADVLEALGLNLSAAPSVVERSIEEVGIGFMFAPSFHPAMRYAVNPRREIGVRTVFNILGPLTNPANAEARLLGVYDEELTEPLASVLKNLSVGRAMVVHGLDGLDEISTVGPTKITFLDHGEVHSLLTSPRDFGVAPASKRALEGSTPEENALLAFKILSDTIGGGDRPKRDITLVNAAAAIYLGGKAETVKEGLAVAEASLKSGAACDKLRALVKFSGGDVSRLEALEKHA